MSIIEELLERKIGSSSLENLNYDLGDAKR
jgi:hypothetical protein